MSIKIVKKNLIFAPKKSPNKLVNVLASQRLKSECACVLIELINYYIGNLEIISEGSISGYSWFELNIPRNWESFGLKSFLAFQKKKKIFPFSY